MTECNTSSLAPDTPIRRQDTLRPPGKAGHLWNNLRNSVFESSFFSGTGETNTSDAADKNDQKALKIAFYNTAAFVCMGALFYTCSQVLYMLQFCMRPLLWALLFGAVLFPVKQLWNKLIISWIDTFSDSGAPLVLGLLLFPFYAIQRFLYWVGDLTVTTYKEMIAALLIILLILLTDMVDILDTFNDITYYLFSVSNFGLDTLHRFHYVVWTLVLGYLVVVCLWKEAQYQVVEWLAMPIWILCIATIISHLGPWRDLIAIFVFAVLGCGTVAALANYKMPDGQESKSGTPLFKPKVVAYDLPNSSSTPIVPEAPAFTPGPTPSRFATPATAFKSRYQTPATSKRAIFTKQASLKFLERKNKISTDKYFSVLWWLVIFTLIGRDIFLVIRLFCLLLVFLAIWQIYKILGLRKRVHEGAKKMGALLVQTVESFSCIYPQSIKGLAIIMMKGQNVMLGVLKRSTNQVVSGAIVVFMLLGIVLVSCFIVYTVHSECLYLLHAVSYFINTRTSHHLKTLDSSLGDWSSGLNSVHSAGRGWIKNKIATLPQGENTKDLEGTLLSLYDNMYQSYISRNVSSTRPNVTMNHLLTTVKGSMNIVSLQSAKTNLAHLVQGTCMENPDQGIIMTNYILCSKGMIMDVMESVWTLISSNMTLLCKLLFSFCSSVLEGGAAFLNFMVQFVVFITALYYLLVYSDHYYAPVEIMTSLLPTTVERAEYTSALFDATRGIFGASFKLAVFYSSYVWVAHTLFSLEMVFMPALLAGILSLIPVVGVYWSSVPGFLVLWLVEGRFLRASAFLVLQILPTYVVDMAVYSEIEGGWHPYITGLAVAGGMYYFGIEGAIIGPLVICILKFIVNLYESFFNNIAKNNTTVRDTDRLVNC